MHAREDIDRRATRTRRVVCAYLILALATALVGPGIAVYAAEGDGPVVESPPDEAAVPTEAPSPVAEEPAPDPEQVPGEDAVVLPAEPGQAEEAAPAPAEEPVPALEEQPAAAPAACPSLEPGGVRVYEPVDGTYTMANVGSVAEPVPDDFQICVDVFETTEGSFFSFR